METESVSWGRSVRLNQLRCHAGLGHQYLALAYGFLFQLALTGTTYLIFVIIIRRLHRVYTIVDLLIPLI